MSRRDVDPVEYQPRLIAAGVIGSRCDLCARGVAPATHLCPWCRGAVSEALFAVDGTVWASTVVHLPGAGRPVPSALAYVDLVDGPRVLVVQDQAEVWSVGTRVTLVPAPDPSAWACAERSGA